MPDLSMRDVFESITSTPEPEFVADLRTQMLTTLRATRAGGSNGTVHQLEPTPGTERVVRASPTISARRRPFRHVSRRRVVTLTAAAAIIVATLVATFAVVRRTPSDITPTRDPKVRSTSPVSSFDQHVSTDVTTNGARLIIDADVALPVAVESNTSSSPGETTQTDVLMLPTVSGTVTNTDSNKNVAIAGFDVQLFLRTDVVSCIVNNEAECQRAIVRPQIQSGATLSANQVLLLSDRHEPSRLRVADTDVSRVLRLVHDGDLVVGFALVATATSGEVASRVFDAEGTLVASCDRLPVDCAEASPVIANAPTTAAASGSASNPPVSPLFPPGEAPAGRYRVEESTIGTIVMDTVAPWYEWEAAFKVFLLGRGDARETELVVFAEWLSVTPTPNDAIQRACPAGALDLGEPTATTLLGQPATMREGTVKVECALNIHRPTAPTAHVGDRIRMVAAEVNGVIVLVFAHAPAHAWPDFASELDTTITSMKLQ
jgi:hypothetical protein